MKYEPYDNWHESVTDDAKQIASLMGWNIDRVYFTGFWSQGDGACFEGSFAYAKGCARNVRRYAPQDERLHDIADRWQALQVRNFYMLEGTVRHRGHYYHENSTEFDWYNRDDSYRALPDGSDDEATEIARDFMRWIYRALEREYEYQCKWAMASAWSDAADEMQDIRKAARSAVADISQAIRIGAGDSIVRTLRGSFRSLVSDYCDKQDERAKIESDFSDVAEFAATNI